MYNICFRVQSTTLISAGGEFLVILSKTNNPGPILFMKSSTDIGSVNTTVNDATRTVSASDVIFLTEGTLVTALFNWSPNGSNASSAELEGTTGTPPQSEGLSYIIFERVK
jgi:hypothetical protein